MIARGTHFGIAVPSLAMDETLPIGSVRRIGIGAGTMKG